MAPLFLELWREQHPEGHEQVQLDFTSKGHAAKLVPLFRDEKEFGHLALAEGRERLSLVQSGQVYEMPTSRPLTGCIFPGIWLAGAAEKILQTEPPKLHLFREAVERKATVSV